MLVYPNYDKCLLNVISSIRRYYSTPIEYKTLPVLDKELDRGYKNIVLIVMDGMGASVIEKNLGRGDFLRKNISQKITTVYPSTTAAAMTSIYTGVSPNEHGWLGWSLFFKEFCRCIDVLTNNDSFTKQPMTQPNIGSFVMPYETIFKDIAVSRKIAVQPFAIQPAGVNFPDTGVIRKRADSFGAMCSLIKKICATEQNTLTLAYWTDPDEIMHKTGCTSAETKAAMLEFNEGLQQLAESLTDTLLIITADHGMIDIEEEVFINSIPEIDSCLSMPPSIEGRAAAFFVKNELMDEFRWQFNKALGKDFKLMTSGELLDKQILGGGRTHRKTYDFLGDFVACGIGKKVISYRTLNSKPKPKHLASHAGLTDDEMTVPLIIVPTEITEATAAQESYLEMMYGNI